MSSRLLSALPVGVVRGVYPERDDTLPSPLDQMSEDLTGVLARRVRARQGRPAGFVERVAARGAALEAMRELELRSRVAELSRQLREEGLEEELVAACFALIRELADRSIGQRHYDVQLLGGYSMLHGMLAEMKTGEGKTLAATLPAATMALAGVPVHVVTVNDYLVQRDAASMGPIYRSLGISVGVVVSGMDPGERRKAYACDVTYCTNKEVAFDYLKDRIVLRCGSSGLRLKLRRMASRREQAPSLLHRGLYFAIVDEADSVLVDEARTPLIISGRKRDAVEEEVYQVALALAKKLRAERDFSIDTRERRIQLSADGKERLAELGEGRGGLWDGPRRRAELVIRALTALHLYVRDEHYLVKDQRIHIVDEFTGRVMKDRSWERGLHQMIEVKERLPITGQQDTLGRISYQRFFRRYLRLAGMTGTAREVAPELWSVYKLPVVPIPTHVPQQRHFLGERVLPTADKKWQAVVDLIAACHERGQPVLVGTRSVAASEQLSRRLDAAGIPHRVLNARQDRQEAEVISEAGEQGRVTVATNMAGRGTDIRLGPGVAELGGLLVLATERHEARRIDRQLFGRCARQGDPGSAESIVSLEDDLLADHATAWLSRLTEAASHGEGRLADWGRRWLLRQYQRRAERLHSRARRDLLKYDEHLESLLSFTGRGE